MKRALSALLFAAMLAGGTDSDQAALVEPLTIGHYAVQLSGSLEGKKIGIIKAMVDME